MPELMSLYPIDQVEDFDFMVTTSDKIKNFKEVDGWNNVKVINQPAFLREIPLCDGALQPPIEIEQLGAILDRAPNGTVEDTTKNKVIILGGALAVIGLASYFYFKG